MPRGFSLRYVQFPVARHDRDQLPFNFTLPMRFVCLIAVVALTLAAADLEGLFPGGNHPAIQYATRPVRDRIAEISRAIQQGKIRLRFEEQHGYLRSLLEALHIPVESQILVYSEASVQANLIHPGNPRALYFNDSILVGWVSGGDFLELAAQDPEQGHRLSSLCNIDRLVLAARILTVFTT